MQFVDEKDTNIGDNIFNPIEIVGVNRPDLDWGHNIIPFESFAFQISNYQSSIVINET